MGILLHCYTGCALCHTHSTKLPNIISCDTFYCGPCAAMNIVRSLDSTVSYEKKNSVCVADVCINRAHVSASPGLAAVHATGRSHFDMLIEPFRCGSPVWRLAERRTDGQTERQPLAIARCHIV